MILRITDPYYNNTLSVLESHWENCERPDHLTDPHLGPVAGAVVPLHAVVVPGVEDGQAGLHRHPGPVQQVLRVVRLGHVVGHELREVT